MNTIGMIVINGLVFSGVYAVLAVGFSLIFGVAKILNMAHTIFYMIAAFVFYYASMEMGIPLFAAAIISPILTAIFGMVCYKFFFDRIKEHSTAVMIVSIAIAMIVQEVFLLSFSGEYRGVKPFVDGAVEIGGVSVLHQYLFSIGVSLVVIICIWFVLFKTKLGKAIRAVALDKEVANLMGIDGSKIALIVMGISALLAGVAGVVVAPISMVFPLMWVNPLVIILAIVVLGGIESVKGAVVGAFILGFAESIVISVIPDGSFLRGAVSLTVMVAVLMIRPEGLFGIIFEEERL